MRIIYSLALLLIIYGCRGELKQPRYELPETYHHSTDGWAKFLTPRQLVDSLNRGVDYDVYFLQDYSLPDTQFIVNIPEMISIMAPEINIIAPNLSPSKPIILTCLYGDDSKRAAQMLSYTGHRCYYLDGGTYRLKQEMERHGWRLLPRPMVQRR